MIFVLTTVTGKIAAASEIVTATAIAPVTIKRAKVVNTIRAIVTTTVATIATKREKATVIALLVMAKVSRTAPQKPTATATANF